MNFVKFKHKAWIKYPYILVTLFPAIYILIAIQYGAVTVPYWDHVELLKTIAAYRDGSFRLDQIWGAHNHSRPLTYRIIYLINGILTDWDITSEYIYMYISIYIGFCIHAFILYKNRNSRIDLLYFVFLSMLSFFYFSPVGHMNHWWSMMLQLQLGNLLMLLALWTAARLPHSWRANIFAAICCWLATYTITNGLLVFLICAFLIFISSSSWRQGLLKLIFWVSNFLAVSILYFPGLPHEAVSINFWKIVQFSLVYLGLPFGGIVDFQFTGPFSSPPDVIFNGLVGLLLCLCSATIIGRLWLKRKINSPPSLFLVGCFIFAISSALVTAMGRSEFGAAYGNSSRYVIYSSYLIYGLLHYFASVYPNNSEDQKWAPIINWGGVKNYLPYLVSALIIFCGVKTYLRGFEVYRGAHDFNARLIEVYANSKSSDEELKLFYPDPTIARQVKTKMQQLNLGVFRYRTLNKMEIPQPSNFVEGLPLPDDAFVIQHIKPKFDNMIGVDVRFITWSKKGPDVTLAWELQDGDHALIERGLISRRPIFDWGYLPISFKKQLDSSSKSYYLILSFPDFNSGNKAAGLPLYSSSPEFPAALIERKGEAATSARGTINLRLQFSD